MIVLLSWFTPSPRQILKTLWTQQVTYSLTHYNVTFNKALRWTCVVIDKSLPVPCFLSHFHPLLITSHFKCAQQDSNCPNAQREATRWDLANQWSRCAHTGLLCADEVETAHTGIHNQSNLVSVIFSRVLCAFAHFNHLSLAFSRWEGFPHTQE